MDKIRVDTEALLQCGVDIGNCAGYASDISGEIDAVLSALPSGCQEKYAGKIKSYMLEMRSISNDLKALRKGVNKAVNTFSECEESLKGRVLSAGEEAFQSDTGENNSKWNKWPLSWLDSILDYLGINKYGRDYVDPGKEREEAHDQLIISQINDLVAGDRYSSETWATLSTEQKKKLLNDLKNELNRIYGLNITKDIDFFTKPSENGLITYGAYRDSERLVRINTECLDDYQIVSTIVHEMRHAYQHEAVRHPDRFEVSEATVRSWEANFDDKKTTEKDGYEAYRNQPVEVDARKIQNGVTYH